ncbi:uncharacterized protein K460DRAFT_354429 [Cucurbitaria berberidis CBS 394.84]|uniref:F-box domain-containing protein n=1 Tax=Cucurbitaria berberidis CBS 394.84 TaxID=1168544 RepID=A0A9P4GF74_9PLEO|nr:uncharacterized protein K460DRAFT_354429 [Cucurbitaria berberidis CBS 394.84]KAF1844517.1 hypothetical protein K460DRAFT_354429 [Cucurbitaria berberidis CBS 394.84]
MALYNSSLELSPELKHAVCALLPLAKLKDVRLVNKQWGDVAASLLYHEFTTSFAETEQRKFDALLTSRANGFLDNVRVLNIDHPASGTVVDDADLKLLQLLCVLPRNSLMIFSSRVPLEMSTVGLLLRTQTRLWSLRVPIQHLGLPSGPPSKEYVNGSLARLVTLGIYATGHEEDGYAKWLPDLVALRGLKIIGSVSLLQAKLAFNGWASLAPAPNLKLRQLYLVNVRLPETPSHIVMCLHLPSLQELSIDSCENSSPLLSLVAQQMAKSTEPSALKVFSRRHEKGMESVEELLNSVSSLKGIVVDAESEIPLAVSCLKSNGTSLQYLLLGFSKGRGAGSMHTDTKYAISELAQLVNTCPNLEVLGVGVANIDFREWSISQAVGISLSSSTTPEGRQMAQALVSTTPVHIGTEFTLMLSQVHLARLSKLRTLCLTHSTYMRFQTNARVRMFRHERIASETFTFMAAHGSPIRYVVFKPSGYGSPRSAATVNGESTWPNFYFRKGKVTSDDPNYMGAVALPMSRAQFGKVEPFHEVTQMF